MQRGVGGVLRPWRRRLWLQRAARWTLFGLAAGLGAAAMVLVIARIVPWADARWWALGAALAGPLAGLAYALATPLSLARTAGQVDRLLGLADRAATAWELRNVEGAFAALQRQDALATLRGHSLSVISLRPRPVGMGAALVAFAVVALLALLPNPMDKVLAERREFQEQIAEARKEVEAGREKLAQPDSRLSAQERESLRLRSGQALEAALKALEERLAQAQDKPEALAALSEAERTLQQLHQPGQSQALQEVSAALGAVPAGAPVAQALQSGDAEALSKALEALVEQLDSLPPEERDALMAALQQAANATAGLGELPGALREAARALGSGQDAAEMAFGDPSASSGQGLEGLLANLQEGAAAERAIASALSAINAARASVSGVALASGDGSSAGDSGADSGGGGEGDGSGAGDGSGDGDGSGEGGGSGSGSGSGSGTGDGSGSGAGSGGTGVGSGGGQGGSGAGNAPGAQQGGMTGRLGADGETVFIPSQGRGGLPGVSVGASPGTVPGELRPYDEVIGQYAAQARDHMERSPVPQGYKDLVRRYFGELEQ